MSIPTIHSAPRDYYQSDDHLVLEKLSVLSEKEEIENEEEKFLIEPRTQAIFKSCLKIDIEEEARLFGLELQSIERSRVKGQNRWNQLVNLFRTKPYCIKCEPFESDETQSRIRQFWDEVILIITCNFSSHDRGILNSMDFKAECWQAMMTAHHESMKDYLRWYLNDFAIDCFSPEQKTKILKTLFQYLLKEGSFAGEEVEEKLKPIAIKIMVFGSRSMPNEEVTLMMTCLMEVMTDEQVLKYIEAFPDCLNKNEEGQCDLLTFTLFNLILQQRPMDHFDLEFMQKIRKDILRINSKEAQQIAVDSWLQNQSWEAFEEILSARYESGFAVSPQNPELSTFPQTSKILWTPEEVVEADEKSEDTSIYLYQDQENFSKKFCKNFCVIL